MLLCSGQLQLRCCCCSVLTLHEAHGIASATQPGKDYTILRHTAAACDTLEASNSAPREACLLLTAQHVRASLLRPRL